MFLFNSYFGLQLYIWIIIVAFLIIMFLYLIRSYYVNKIVMDYNVAYPQVDERVLGATGSEYSGSLLPWEVFTDIRLLQETISTL